MITTRRQQFRHIDGLRLWLGLIATLSLMQSGVLRAATITATNNPTIWNVPGDWTPNAVPGAGDNIIIPDNINVTVNSAGEQFGDAANASQWFPTNETLRVDGGNTLTHNSGSTFEIRNGNSIWRIRGTGGSTFLNEGTVLQLPRNNSSDTGRLNDANFTYETRGVHEFQDMADNGNLRSNSLLVEGNSINVVVDSTGARTGVFRTNMANDPDLVATLNFRQSETSNTLTYTGDAGETPFDVVAGHFMFGLPGRGTLPSGTDSTFKFNGSDFNGDSTTLTGGAPLHTAFDRTVFDDLFGTASGDIPTGSLVGVSGAFDTIDLISANSGSTATPDVHNFDGRIGIGGHRWQDVGNMMPTSETGTLTITSTSDVDWYSGGFNTRGGLIENNGTLTAGAGRTVDQDENTAGTSQARLFIGRSGGTAGEFRNTSTGVVRIEEGTLEVRDAGNTFNNQAGGLVDMAGGNLDVRDSAFFQNFGTVELSADGASLRNFDANAIFQQEAGGAFNVNPGAGNRAAILGNNELSGFNNNTGGAGINLIDGILNFAPTRYEIAGVQQTVLDNALINSEFNVTPGATLEVGGGTWTLVDPDPTGTLPAGLTIAGRIINSASGGARAPIGGTMTLGDGVNDLTYIWDGSANAGSLFADPTSEFVNNTTITRINSGRFFGGGLFTNNGTIDITENGSVLFFDSVGTTYENFGLTLFSGNDDSFRFNGDNQTIDNKAGGIFRINADSENNTLAFQTNGTRSGDVFTNNGTIEVLRGIMNVDDAVGTAVFTFNGVSATSLDTGIYRVISTGTDRSQLDLQVNGTDKGDAAEDNYDGSIDTINAGATLVLSSDNPIGTGDGAQFPQLGAIDTLSGNLLVHGAVELPLDPSITVNPSALIGGDGTFDMQGGTLTLPNGATLDPGALNSDSTATTASELTGTLTVDGNLTLNNDTQLALTLDPNNVSDRVVVTGDLVLNGVVDVTGGLGGGRWVIFEFLGNLTDNGLILPSENFRLDTSVPGEVALLLVPEPSGLLLSSLGMFGLVRVSRRRRTRK